MEESGFCEVDRILLRCKGFYFFSLGAIGSLLPFIALYMKQIGMTESQTGILYGLMPFVGFLIRPLFGAIADKFKKHKLILFICCILTALSFNLMLLVPYKKLKHTSVQSDIMCSQADSYLRDCYNKNETINEHACPMSFHSYINKVKKNFNVENGPAVSSVLHMNSSNNVPYEISTLSNSVTSVYETTSCNLNCKYKSVPLIPQQVCFTNATGWYDITQCYDVDLTYGVGIQIPDVGYLLRKEVVADKIEFDNQVCRDYDLKEITYKNQEYWQMLCSEDTILTCDIKCTHIETCTVSVAENLSSAGFWMFFVLLLFGNVFFAPILSLGDAMLYVILGEERRHKWGKQRLFGTIGFAIFALATTASMDALHYGSKLNMFTISFFLFSFLNIVTGFVVYVMRISDDLKCGSLLTGTCELLRNFEFSILLFVLFYFGLLTGAIETFLYWFLEADLGNKLKILPGLCLAVSCTSEVVFMFFSGRIIARFGRECCLYATFVAYALRFIGYSFLTNVWAVLPIELLHGITFGLMWVSATSLGSIISPPGMAGTVQGLISGVHFGFGKGVGSLMTGQLYTQIGFRWTFRFYGILSIVLLVLYVVLNKTVFKHSRLPSTEEVKMETEMKDKAGIDVNDPLIKDKDENTENTEKVL